MPASEQLRLHSRKRYHQAGIPQLYLPAAQGIASQTALYYVIFRMSLYSYPIAHKNMFIYYINMERTKPTKSESKFKNMTVKILRSVAGYFSAAEAQHNREVQIYEKEIEKYRKRKAEKAKEAEKAKQLQMTINSGKKTLTKLKSNKIAPSRVDFYAEATKVINNVDKDFSKYRKTIVTRR
jgi:hypothetical protein